MHHNTLSINNTLIKGPNKMDWDVVLQTRLVIWQQIETQFVIKFLILAHVLIGIIE